MLELLYTHYRLELVVLHPLSYGMNVLIGIFFFLVQYIHKLQSNRERQYAMQNKIGGLTFGGE